MAGPVQCQGDHGDRIIFLEHVCDEHHGHYHLQDHFMTVLEGEAEVWEARPTGAENPLTLLATLRPGDEPYLVKASIRHTYKAKAPNTRVQCRFLLRDRQGNPVILDQIYPENVTVIDERWFF